MVASKPELGCPRGQENEQGESAVRYLAFVLLAGCMHAPDGDFCDIARPMYFDTADTINWLADNDRPLLEGVVAHNEVLALCRR